MLENLIRNVLARQVLRYFGMLLAGWGVGSSDMLADPELFQIIAIAVGLVLSFIAERAWILARRAGLTT